MKFLILGNPENRRVTLFCQELRKKRIPFDIVSYLSFIKNIDLLNAKLTENSVLRIDSPGENIQLYKEILELGYRNNKRTYKQISKKHLLEECLDGTRVEFMHQWYLGYLKILSMIKSTQKVNQAVMNSPDVIRHLFDKHFCNEHLRSGGVSCTQKLGLLKSYEQCLKLMDRKQCSKVFIKPCSGSSASGVVAFQKSKSKVLAVSSASFHKGVYSNSLRIRRYSDEKLVSHLIDHLAKENCVIERWTPKLSLNQRTIDFRVLVINGKAKHVVARSSKSPMTNLHLGNQRGELETIKTFVGKKAWKAMLEECEKAAALFKEAFYIGVDVMLENRVLKPVIIELNAFGDLIPNITWRRQSTYSAEINDYLRWHNKA